MTALEKSLPHLILRAVTTAVRLAMDPPEVKIPPPIFWGKPNIFKSHWMVMISNSAAAGDPAQPPANTLKPVARASAMTLIYLLGPGTKEKDLGCPMFPELAMT